MSSATCTAWKLCRSCHGNKALSVQPAFVYFFWSAKPYSINFGWRSKTCSVLFLFLGGSEEFLFVLTKFLSNAFWKWADVFFVIFDVRGDLSFRIQGIFCEMRFQMMQKWLIFQLLFKFDKLPVSHLKDILDESCLDSKITASAFHRTAKCLFRTSAGNLPLQLVVTYRQNDECILNSSSS